MLFRFGPEDLHEMRILIVEDDYLLAADLAETMRERGAEVNGPAATLDEALRAVETRWIDRAVLDVDLGGETSCKIADRLEAAGIPYVIASGLDSASMPARFRGKPRLPKTYPPPPPPPRRGA